MLDCGIGGGALSLTLSRVVGTRLRLDGIDIAPRMLREAGEILDRAGLSGARLHRRDVRELSFADNTFDLVMSAHLLEYLAGPLAGLREMGRVLRPRAPLVVVVTRYASISPARLARWMGEVGLDEVRTY